MVYPEELKTEHSAFEGIQPMPFDGLQTYVREKTDALKQSLHAKVLDTKQLSEILESHTPNPSQAITTRVTHALTPFSALLGIGNNNPTRAYMRWRKNDLHLLLYKGAANGAAIPLIGAATEFAQIKGVRLVVRAPQPNVIHNSPYAFAEFRRLTRGTYRFSPHNQ